MNSTTYFIFHATLHSNSPVDVESSDDGPSEAKRRKVDDEEEKENGAKKSKCHVVPELYITKKKVNGSSYGNEASE